jgi:hypothetical protein
VVEIVIDSDFNIFLVVVVCIRRNGKGFGVVRCSKVFKHKLHENMKNMKTVYYKSISISIQICTS